MKSSPLWAILAGLLIGSCAAFASAQFLDMSKKVFLMVEQRYDKAARLRVEAWHRLMIEASANKESSDLDRAELANDFFNKLEWVDDLEHWGKKDYWATPLEMLATNGGDCEDFSVAKYFTLNESGVDNEKLRITYVKALDYNQAHMVLAYYPTPEAEPLILDNINKTILPASQRNDLVPIYSFNAEGLWLAKFRERKLPNSGKSLPQWKSLNERIAVELML
ncbi:transglutaminase-like cysteine peptidase [Pseudomaricurvus sp.]|uniref:transglutaminase-like cysteine peptidase n=1 Tax=Pseudomaricurvus sp. TaxID=2004510 RepID=UPI003F6C92D7